MRTASCWGEAFVATWRAASRLGGHCDAVLNATGGMGGGIFALRRPRPYSRHCEEIVAGYAAPTIVYAHIGINGSGEWADNDAARRVATPSKERENMF